MAEENEESEPSMDNILSSIRKILSEDEKSTEVAGDPPQVATQSPVTDEETNKETEMTSAMEVSEPDLENGDEPELGPVDRHSFRKHKFEPPKMDENCFDFVRK